MAQKVQLLFDRVENIVGKGEICCLLTSLGYVGASHCSPKFSADKTLEKQDIISCTVRWQGTWKLVHGCGESCRPEPKTRWRHDLTQP